MISLTADANLTVLPRQANTLSEVRDPNGDIIGFFVPVSLDRAKEYANAAAHVSPAVVREAKEAPGQNHSTAQVLEHLKSLKKA